MNRLKLSNQELDKENKELKGNFIEAQRYFEK